MTPIREYLDVLFRRIQPEVMVKNFLELYGGGEACPLQLNSRNISVRTFQHYSGLNFKNYSPDEVENFYLDMQQSMREDANDRKRSIFFLLPQYTKDVLVVDGKTPYCKYMELLNWRKVSLRLGQGMLLTAHLAYIDWKCGSRRDFFAWNSIIESDNVRLGNMLKKGVAENHFHLYGSTQSFLLAWVSLMNHPDKIARYFKTQEAGTRMRENLNENITLGVLDNQMEWTKRFYIAAWIRKELFQRLNASSEKLSESGEKLVQFMQFMDVPGMTDEIKTLRYLYGVKVRQPSARQNAVLDYAMTLEGNDWSGYGYNRLFTGERRFLYDCFYYCYNAGFTDVEQDMFYIYLLIKAQFRSELIQVNQKVGFKNFSTYQDRKTDFWEDIPEYMYEAHRIAVGGSLKGQSLRSLEARITPAESGENNIRKALQIDTYMHFSEKYNYQKPQKIMKWGEDQKYFFVIHFVKGRENLRRNYNFLEYPRNYNTRVMTIQRAFALCHALERSDYYWNRVYGIDACSNEIGCRPEIFAVAFRMLRNPLRRVVDGLGEIRIENRRMRITYHVGEDFLDLADGLRAIDEAIIYLGLQQGDRLGHALALGVIPRKHYRLKQEVITLPKQDMLDNYVWIRYRSVELGIPIESKLAEELEYKAKELLYDIYPADEYGLPHLKNYYESWKLRGDEPELYRLGKYQRNAAFFDNTFERAKITNAFDMQRKQDEITHLYYRYLFGNEEKKRGEQIVVGRVSDLYVEHMERMQSCLQGIVFKRGIAIEANPTSNVLIGTFGRYDDHPMLNLNNYALHGEKQSHASMQLNVSINTDDQGVFDTLLENEYALMACALEKCHDEKGEKIYSQDAIYDYLDRIRQNGLDQIFRQVIH